MTTVNIGDVPSQKSLRLWPGIAIAIVQLLVMFVLPIVMPDIAIFGVLGGFVGSFLIALWWLFFSRAPWVERLGVVALMAAALFATRPFLHESIGTGAMGVLYFILAVPGVGLALVAAALATRQLSTTARRVTIAVAIVLASGAWTLVRTGGFTGEFDNDLSWRWAPNSEERLLARAVEEPPVPTSPPAAAAPAPVAAATPVPAAPETPTVVPDRVEATPVPVAAVKKDPEWPGFRGAARNGIIDDVRIETNWAASPPVELWRRPIGPGWSSFAVNGDLIYTQEQRGEDEIVACYKAATGEPVWRHRDPARFWESNGGAGPRGTPTLSDGRVYTLGATGIVNALDARDGSVAWSRNAASDTGAKTPMWGFSGSPLVLDDLVIVAASGALIAYDRASGEPRWRGPVGDEGYSSPQLVTIDGTPQVVLLSGTGAAGFAPGDGTRLWEHAWKGYPIVQPAQTADGNLLVSVTESSGTRRLAVSHGTDGWKVEERWTSMGLKPYFNDFVVHNGHAFGFDGGILACIDLKDGNRKWKGGRYGHGQLVLLREQDVLLVLSEEGELALVKAAPDQFTEIARVPALEGKTWNHPVLVGDVLLTRNGEEMAAFRLARAAR
jgi:outer membrane protein assembly factor BamB